MRKIKILWIDDEIDLLHSQILFLQDKGYEIDTANNGVDAVEKVREEIYDVVLLDEQMPGLSGLETLEQIKNSFSELPVVMITKSEEEDLMEQAIGSKIADYLIKPVRPQQLLLTLKKLTERSKIRESHSASKYQSEFMRLSQRIMMAGSFRDWVDIYERLVFWDIELEEAGSSGMASVLADQRTEANREFSRFIQKNYPRWFGEGDNPVLSPQVFRKWVFPQVKNGTKTVVIVIDNLRLDQWKILYGLIQEYFMLEEENIYYGILPTVTQYARNAIFAGLMPLEIHKLLPQYWRFDEEEGNKNEFEAALLAEQIKREGLNIKHVYRKILNQNEGKKILEGIPNLLNNDLVVLVYNFVDMLSHARTEMNMIRELARDEKAFRALTRTWFEHSYMYPLVRLLAKKNIRLCITTDHGSIDVETPVKVVGDRDTTTNLRYKLGRNLNYNPKEVFGVRQPEQIHLPKDHITSTYVFAREKQYLIYPKNMNYYIRFFKGTFQHGGISMEEMLIPFAVLKPRQQEQ
ncbi:MAG: bifunctional response regulator/alkaline phosphatase family protein [Bacteroidales bacterium]|nr:bifunctional response regulator/alkaline phosphatase family protein [Bacteroidales bacterium]